MKKIKKTLALVMSLAMILGMAIGLTASAGPPPSGSITINAPSEGYTTIVNQEFSVYLVFDLDVTTDGSGAIDGYLYKLNPIFSGFPAAFVGTYGGTEATLLAFIDNLSITTAQLNQLAEDLKAFIDAGGPIAPTALSDPATATGSAPRGTVTIPDLPYGYYLVTGDTNEAMAMHRLVTLPGPGVANNDIIITLKADAPTIDKEVWFHEGVGASTPTNPADPGWQDWTDVNIGDTVYFKHESRVPNMFGYDLYQFIVHDSMSAGLTLNHEDESTSSFNVKVGVTNLTQVANQAAFTTTVGGAAEFYVAVVTGADYTRGKPLLHEAYTESGTTNFMVVINPRWFVMQTPTSPAANDIFITYEATLNANAIIAYEDPNSNGDDWGNPNKVYLEYSNNPYNTGNGNYGNGSTDDTPEDEVWVYTFDFDLYKYTGTLGSGEKELADAEFELRTVAADDTTAIEFVLDTAGTTTLPAIYRVATDDDPIANIVTTLVTPASGLVSIIGVDAGTYYLVEINAPPGYNPLDTHVTVLIEHTHTGGGAGGSYTVKQDGTLTAAVNIQNENGAVFPGTGGIGRTIFMIVGLSLMVGAIVVLVVRRKISKIVYAV